MLSRMTHEQFAEWCAKDIIEPIGQSGTHDILAKIGVLIAAFMGNKDITIQTFKHWMDTADEDTSEDVIFQALETVGGRRT